jgi:hypothetical protein
LLAAVQRAIGAIADVQADQALPAGDPVLTLYWALLHFQALAEQFGPHALFDVQLAAAAGTRRAATHTGFHAVHTQCRPRTAPGCAPCGGPGHGAVFRHAQSAAVLP